MAKITLSSLLIVLSLLLLPIPASVLAEESQQARYAGSERCMDCHDQKLFGAHAAKANPASPAGGHGCESCHGPSLAHVLAQESGAEDGVPRRSLNEGSAEERSQMCLTCHSNERALTHWDGSAHERREVACLDCHTAHTSNRQYLVQTEADLCVRCHKDVRSELWKTSHHPIREGKMTCSDCHNPHGTVTENLLTAMSTNELCYECHAEKRGPFLWEHAPVSEDCSNCHTPHGSAHDKLLVLKMPFLCQTCHSGGRHPGTLYARNPGQAGQSVYSTLNNRAFYRSCYNCHSQVHGSNHPSGKSLAR